MMSVDFVFNGKKYTAELSEPSGTGGKTFHVLVNRRYFGIVHQVADNDDPTAPIISGMGKLKWVYSSQNGKLQEFEKLFVDAVKKYLAV